MGHGTDAGRNTTAEKGDAQSIATGVSLFKKEKQVYLPREE